MCTHTTPLLYYSGGGVPPDSHTVDILPHFMTRAEPGDIILGGGGEEVRFENQLVEDGSNTVEISGCKVGHDSRQIMADGRIDGGVGNAYD